MSASLACGLTLAAALLANLPGASAEAIFLAPRPYLSRADSPFPVDGSNSRFFLEDFEDGELNTPGLFQPLSLVTYGIVQGPGAGTHSVDGDDGALDGWGRDGHSLASSSYGFHPTDPPRSWSTIYLSFDATELGFLPNSFGFVWTHGVPASRVQMRLFNSEWVEIGSNIVNGIGESSAMPSVDDRFFGVISNVPIAAVEITSFYDGLPSQFQLDHVQYGLAIPEPAGLIQAVGLAIGVVLTRRRRQYGMTTLRSQ